MMQRLSMTHTGEHLVVPRCDAVGASSKSAALGGHPLPVFPVRDDKRPACPGGFHAANADPKLIDELWRRWPAPLTGVPTGEITGFDVLDIDPAGLDWWQRHRDRLPPTRMHRTRRGGLHLLFGHTLGLRCSAGALASGVDVRADGGFVVWWPAAGFEVDDRPLADWPEWVLAELQRGRRPSTSVTISPAKLETGGDGHRNKRRTPSREERFANTAVFRAMDRVEDTRVGTRNARLNAEAFALGRLVARDWVKVEWVVRCLELAATANGLAHDDGLDQVRRTIMSGITAGQARPYHDLLPRTGE